MEWRVGDVDCWMRGRPQSPVPLRLDPMLIVYLVCMYVCLYLTLLLLMRTGFEIEGMTLE